MNNTPYKNDMNNGSELNQDNLTFVTIFFQWDILKGISLKFRHN